MSENKVMEKLKKYVQEHWNRALQHHTTCIDFGRGNIELKNLSACQLKQVVDWVLKQPMQPIYNPGDKVWYMFGDRIQQSKVEYCMNGEDDDICYKTLLGHTIYEKDTFDSVDFLLEYLKNNVNSE